MFKGAGDDRCVERGSSKVCILAHRAVETSPTNTLVTGLDLDLHPLFIYFCQCYAQISTFARGVRTFRCRFGQVYIAGTARRYCDAVGTSVLQPRTCKPIYSRWGRHRRYNQAICPTYFLTSSVAQMIMRFKSQSSG